MMFLSLKKQYNNAVNTELTQIKSIAKATSVPLTALPAALRNYLQYCGYDGNSINDYCTIKWKSAHLKMAPGKSWSRLHCEQVNFISRPARFVYMKAKVRQLFPFEAVDKFQNGRGNMLIKLLRYFTVTDAKGLEMDTAELVTILAEAMLIPAYFFQPYITWTELNPLAVQGTIRYGDTKASGVFYFNEHCELLRFETNDRYYFQNGKMEKHKWTAYTWNYKTYDNVKSPSNFMAVWSLPTGDHTYFKGRLDAVEYA